MVSHVATRAEAKPRRFVTLWVATWHRVGAWAASRDLTRIDLSVQAALHLLWGLGISLLPAALRTSPTLDAMFDGTLLGVQLQTLWSVAYVLSGLALFAACRWHDRWRIVHIAWTVAIPLVLMWLVGMAIETGEGQAGLLASLLFAGMFFWHLTTAVRLWARLD